MNILGLNLTIPYKMLIKIYAATRKAQRLVTTFNNIFSSVTAV